MINDYIIIGAGLSGLNTATKLNQLNFNNVLVLDKARGVGGRIATRRTLDTKFDHGAQFYKVKEDINELHQYWKHKGIGHKWFTKNHIEYWSSSAGMTAFPKAMMDGLNILLEKQITTITQENDLWKLTSDKGEEWISEKLIISSPLPQTNKLLENLDDKNILNNKVYDELKKITYQKALVLLVSLEEDITLNDHGYLEFNDGVLYSIADQKAKGLSQIPAYTITMGPDFSENEFDIADSEITAKILDHLSKVLPTIKVKEVELKKWRYCKPNSSIGTLFVEVAPKLFLIGDSFGGPSLSGALRSSNALIKHLTQSSTT